MGSGTQNLESTTPHLRYARTTPVLRRFSHITAVVEETRLTHSPSVFMLFRNPRIPTVIGHVIHANHDAQWILGGRGLGCWQAARIVARAPAPDRDFAQLPPAPRHVVPGGVHAGLNVTDVEKCPRQRPAQVGGGAPIPGKMGSLF